MKNIRLNAVRHFHKNGIYFWFALAVSTLLFYDPFNQAILEDRAYFSYLAQCFSRGEYFYKTTTFGYTPLGPMIAGGWIKVIQYVDPSISSISISRVGAILFHGIIASSFFYIGKEIFVKASAAHLCALLYSAIGFLCILSSVTIEPKMLVFFFTLWVIFFASKGQPISAGFFAASAAMCWHVSVILLLPVTVYFFRSQQSTGKSFVTLFKLSLGVMIGLLPSVIYITLTDSWVDFWNQAILRKILLEGSAVFDTPFRWLVKGVWPVFATEVVFFIFGILGFLWSTSRLLAGLQNNSPYRKREIQMLLISMVITWSLFNTMEFQGAPDMIPMLVFILIFCSEFFVRLRLKYPRVKHLILLAVLLYGFSDALIYKVQYSFADQVKLFDEINQKSVKVFSIGAEDYYVLSEKRKLTKYMRHTSYEDTLVEIIDAGSCDNVLNEITAFGPEIIIVNTRFRIGKCGMEVLQLFLEMEKDSIKKGVSNFRKMHSKSDRLAYYLVLNRGGMPATLLPKQ